MKQVSDSAEILIMLPCYLGYIWAADQFCKRCLDISKRNEVLFVSSLFSGWMVVDITNVCRFVPNIAFTLVKHIFFMVLVLWLFRGDKEKKLFVAAILILVTTSVPEFCWSFLSCLALFLLHTVKGVPEPIVNGWEVYPIGYITFAVAAGTVYWISRHSMSVFQGKVRKWYLVLAVPLLVVTEVIDLAGWGASKGILLRSGGNFNLYYDQLFSYGGNCVLTALAMFATGFYVFGMDRIYLEQEKSSQYHAQIAAYKMLEEQYSRQERLRHDMNNHMIALSGLLENKDWEKMNDYLRNMRDSGSLGTLDEITGNRIVDALLYQKRQMAERKNIIWKCDVQMPKRCCMKEFDLCVLFGNILDNAVEECERLQIGESHYKEDPFIDIQAKAVKKFFLLEVKNSAGKMNHYKAGFTDKENPKGHGIGLLNIRDVVHRYNGVINIEDQNGIFVISVLIPLNDAAYDNKESV
ncbi:MAG: ATP-binding protein [Lachnospiraceae bacterium]|nr:ATP-binding protein [Lachnospiraceae bacterium]